MSSPLSPADRLIVALDVPTAADALALAGKLRPDCRWVKVGMELFYAAGPDIIARLRDLGLEVFLDLKLYDIPNTVASAVRSVAKSGASLLTVHASGGPAMLAAAQQAAAGDIRLLAVTVLTSMDATELSAIGLAISPEEQVLRLGQLAADSGMDGLVCSPREVAQLRQSLGASALLVIPGIRPAGSAADDQRRTATPTEAIVAGASMLVVGRPITKAGDPNAAAQEILKQIEAAL